jgi:hypothetical protein
VSSGSQTSPGRAAWIGGKRFDLGFFFGGSALAVVLGFAMLAWPLLVVPLWWLWLALVDGPHLISTWIRTYLDPVERAKHRRLLATSLVFFLPGFGAFALMKMTGQRIVFDLYLLFATFWSYYHAIRQQYGILSIYQRHAGTDARGRKIDAAFLTWGLWAFYFLFMIGHPASRVVLQMPRELPGWADALLIAWAAALAALTAGYVVRVIALARAGRDVRPQLFVLLPVIATQAVALFLVGAHEPLFPAATNPEQLFLAAAVVGGLPHGVQYLGIVFTVGRRRWEKGGDSLAARLGRAPALAYAVCVGVSVGYVLLNAARGTSPGFGFFALDSDAALLFLAFYWGAFFHHFWLDQYIWRVQSDPDLRRELGLTVSSAP